MLTLTSGERLSRELRLHFDRAQQRQQLHVWPSKKTMSLSSWLRHCYRWGCVESPTRAVLSSLQARLIWQSLDTDFSASALEKASSDYEAFVLAERSAVPWSDPLWRLTEASHRLQAQAQKYHQHLQSMGLVDECSLLSILIEKGVPSLKLDDSLIFSGFDEKPAGLQRFLGHKIFQGKDIQWQQPEETAPMAQVYKSTVSDDRQGYLTIAQHIMDYLQRHPGARVAWLSPYFTHDKGFMEHALFLRGAQREQGPLGFHSALGDFFLSYPWIQAMILALSCDEPLHVREWKLLLESRFFFSQAVTWEERLRIAAWLMTQGSQRYTRLELCACLSKFKYGSAFRQQLLSVKGFASVKQSVALWVRDLEERCTTWGAPQTLDDIFSMQCLASLNILLEEFRHTARWLPDLNYREWLHLLRWVFKEKRVPPPSLTEEPPIQLMGVLECSGLSFDAIWLHGLHQGAWPLSGRLPISIPLALAERYQLRDASPDQDSQRSQKIEHRLLRCASKLYLSHALSEHGVPLEPCAWFESLQGESWPPIRPHHQQAIAKSTRSKQTQLPSLRPEAATGGSLSLKLQASCPFKAASRLRANIPEPGDFHFGLGPLGRGKILHAALDILATHFQNRETLRSWSEKHETTEIATALDEAFRKHEIRLKPGLEALERQRAQRLLSEWLAFEKNRPFFEVIACEQKHTLSLAGRTWHLTLDRLDRLDHGKILIVDYKTGPVSRQHWLTPRPDDPQLPLYALLPIPDRVGVAFALLRDREIGFKGFSQVDLGLPGIETHLRVGEEWMTWSDLYPLWASELSRLAEQYVAGEAHVDPKNQRICSTCGYPSLCRIQETGGYS